ncbi:glycoside hydrolase family 127 protein [Actinospica sp. MGRD01-02]|uniref:Glycoside hydrolase family 127 protein n=1 Tax=Actinospica acidithermotolerans TaxID=2828514 RepID=A0A941EGG3_9ACTN|nr:beta-L-arabinofuranosidase domain-containing protein [Actinospica acidithermotolerans]MBR7827209.1 glycoside hydrolase family 127 protein [Actinospica acidithermotolerans]
MNSGGLDRPVAALSADAKAVLRPLPAGSVRFGPGFWSERVAVNNERSLAAGLERITASGVLENLEIAAGKADGPYRGDLVFLDTDAYKWLEAVSWSLRDGSAPELLESAKAVIELIRAAAEPDGYVNSYTTVVRGGERWADLLNGHEMYCAGHLIQAGIAHRRATGETGLYEVAIRFADVLVAEFGEHGRRAGYCGHPEIETALVELYRESGTRAYLDLARRMVDLRGGGLIGEHRFGRHYFQDTTPVRETRSLHGHAVRALYLAAGVTDLYLETGDEQLLTALRAQWADLVRGKAYLTGGAGARHLDEGFGDAFELPADRAYTETCAAIALMQWSWRMLLATGEAQFADMFERVLYNGFLAGVSLDGSRFFYVNPLQVRPDSTLGPGGRQEWFHCACCPPNVMRTLASLSHYVATVDGDGLQIHQYASGSIRSPQGFGADVRTGYPFEGGVSITIPGEAAGEWTLSLRVPRWARGRVEAALDGWPIDVGTADRLRITRRWRGGERIEVGFPVEPRLTVADPRVDDARGCVAVECGPLVYCAEQVDQDADIDTLVLSGAAELGAEREIGGIALPTVRVDATAAGSAAPEEDWPYRTLGAAAETGVRGRVTAVPYFAWANREAGAMRVWLPHRAVRSS